MNLLQRFLLGVAFICFGLTVVGPEIFAAELVKKIKIEGNLKIESDAILAKMVSKEGQEFSIEELRQDVQKLFQMGYFYDVQVFREKTSDGIALTYKVVEKPSVAEIEYNGNSEIDDSDLAEATQLKAFEILNLEKIQEAVEKILKQYEEKGYFLAKVDYRLVDLPDPDKVKLVFDIQENDKVQVRRITFIGNEKLSSSKLKGRLQTQEGSAFSFISGAGAYKQEAFEQDLQILNFLYFNEGFIQVKIDRPEITVSPDKKGLYISIRIEEGEQFNVGTVDFSGDLLFSKEELLREIEIDDSKLFVYETMQKDLQTLQAKYGDLGYAFANPIPRTRIRERDREVDITFEIDKGNKVYIGQIQVLGNVRTRDKVVRRELRIREGELYNETRKRESLARVKRLGFFEEVNFNTRTPSGTYDIMDIDIVVKERSTGTIQVGAGYSSFQGFVFNGQVSQINFLGKGQSLTASADVAWQQRLFRLSFTDPFIFDSNWSGGGDLYANRRNLFDFQEDKTGGAIRVGHPLGPYLDGIVRYKLDDTRLQLFNNSDPDLFPVETANGLTSSLTFILEYDKRDDRFEPTKGIFSSGSIEYAGLGGDQRYTKGFGIFRFYREILPGLIWRNNLNYGFVSSNDPNRPVPFNELFLLGGANSLRGFQWFTVGRREFSRRAFSEAVANGDPNAFETALKPFGGMQQLFYNLEFQFSLIKEAGIRGVVFYDVGAADNNFAIDTFRQNYGFGFRWFSPIGPLRFEWGFPINRRPELGEDPVNFEFAIGQPF